ncbi:MAG: cupin domain-containing protein [Rhodospirillales bacterium]|nr:cupin domain-containing protein [Rhodospirillales bacterium]
MTLNIRRIVTDHDSEGRAIVGMDEVMTNVHKLRSGNIQTLIWMTDDTPADIDGDEDPAAREIDIEPPARGSVFRILELAPGKDAYMHRTDTIDYAICMSGECDMLLDDDAEVHMSAGDVMVQRATWHGWTNRGTEPCQIAFILIGSHPPSKTLHP